MSVDNISPRCRESGFSLIEIVVLVAIVAIVAGLSFEALAQRPAQLRSTAVAFAGLVAEARALAALNGALEPKSGSGASIAVVRDGNIYVATLYAYRPMQSSSQIPVRAADSPPLRTSTAITIVQNQAMLAPPFVLFFSAGGHASVAAPFRLDVDPPLAMEPSCSREHGVVIAFSDGVHTQAHTLSCALARLDIDTPAPLSVLQ